MSGIRSIPPYVQAFGENPEFPAGPLAELPYGPEAYSINVMAERDFLRDAFLLVITARLNRRDIARVKYFLTPNGWAKAGDGATAGPTLFVPHECVTVDVPDTRRIVELEARIKALERALYHAEARIEEAKTA